MDKVNAGSIIHFILESFGQKPRIRLILAQKQLEEFLSEMHERGQRVCLGFDECHRLSDVTLTALKNFYELGTGGYDRFLGLVLFGQPQFEKRLYAVNFREIAERLAIVQMPSMSKFTHEYIAHRLSLVGGNVEELFEKRAIDLIASQVETPLGIGNLANKALLSAYEKGEPKVLARFVEKDIEPETRRVASGKLREASKVPVFNPYTENGK
jgi:type II secretory pathway predicted ATPase ExeA